MHFITDMLYTKQDLFHELSITVLDASVESESPRIRNVRNAFTSLYKAYSLESPPRFKFHSFRVLGLNFCEIIYTK